mmetsp:Transcript_26990/g.67984  ORF Transcript_26990/g.67984 Transcript_26990/m.67984 type:complete len:255 (+) Transcript_26990:584-1348(+)
MSVQCPKAATFDGLHFVVNPFQQTPDFGRRRLSEEFVGTFCSIASRLPIFRPLPLPLILVELVQRLQERIHFLKEQQVLPRLALLRFRLQHRPLLLGAQFLAHRYGALFGVRGGHHSRLRILLWYARGHRHRSSLAIPVGLAFLSFEKRRGRRVESPLASEHVSVRGQGQSVGLGFIGDPQKPLALRFIHLRSPRLVVPLRAGHFQGLPRSCDRQNKAPHVVRCCCPLPLPAVVFVVRCVFKASLLDEEPPRFY